MTWMQTHTGLVFDLQSPTAEMVEPLDLAHALSQLCRYAGHTIRHYSVAEHSSHLHDWMLANCHDHLALAALLHDAAEAYVCDVPAPVKMALGKAVNEAWHDLTDPIDEAIAERFDLNWMLLIDPVIKDADRRILHDEREALLGAEARGWGIPGPPLGIAIEGWDANKAKHEWLNRLQARRPERGQITRTALLHTAATP